VVVEPEVNETNKTTLRSERRGALKKKKKGDRKIGKKQKKDLTGPTLLEMPSERAANSRESAAPPLGFPRFFSLNCFPRRFRAARIVAGKRIAYFRCSSRRKAAVNPGFQLKFAGYVDMFKPQLHRAQAKTAGKLLLSRRLVL